MQLQNPLFMALIQLMSLYARFSVKNEEKDLTPLDFTSEEMSLTEENTILLLKQLVKEFGIGLRDLINDAGSDRTKQTEKAFRLSPLQEANSYEKISKFVKESLLQKLNHIKMLREGNP
jgi:hypothetical protein